jgi:hypothetical protein
MTPLRKAAIAFNELLSDYVPTEIVDILHDHHYIGRETEFLARCYSRLELEELGEVEQIIEDFFEEVANESILEENLTDWQREVITGINQVIEHSIFRGLFSIRNTLTAYDDIEIASIVAEVCNSKGLLNKLTKHFYLQYKEKFQYKEIEAFIYKIFKGNISEGNLSNWQQDIIRQINELDFLNKFNLNFHDIYLYIESIGENSQDDVSDIESLLSHDEVLEGSEAIIGPSFNIPFGDAKYIQGNRIHKVLAGIENTYKRLFYQKRSEEAKESKIDHVVVHYERYRETDTEIQEKIEEIQYRKDNSVFGILFDSEALATLQTRKDSDLTDRWGDIAAYPNFATAKLSYIGKDGKLHIKPIKSSDLAKSKAVKAYKTQINTHAEGQIFEYVRELMELKTKYQEASRIIVDVHTKIDMCSARKPRGESWTSEGTCTKVAHSLTTKYKNVVVRVSYDVYDDKLGLKDYNYLCRPCKPVDNSIWRTKYVKPTNSMLQQRIYEDFEYLEEKLNLDEIIWSTGTERYYSSSVEKVKKAHYQHIIDYYLNERNMHSVDVDPDGNCFFRAIARQFEIMNGEKILTYDQIRQFAVNYMLEHPDQFNGFTENNLDQYIDSMSKNGTWADNPIIQALADEFNINIDIHRIDGSITHILARLTLFNDLPPAVTLNIAYTGNHYLSAEPLANQEQDENIERLVQAMGRNSLEDSQNFVSPDKHKPSSAPTLMPTLAPTAISKINETSSVYEGVFSGEINSEANEYYLKVFAIFLGLNSSI